MRIGQKFQIGVASLALFVVGACSGGPLSNREKGALIGGGAGAGGGALIGGLAAGAPGTGAAIGGAAGAIGGALVGDERDRRERGE
ncbi:MAG: hypothetical protein ACRERD_04975 [Candidatus Binatia bacterium]